MNTLSRYVAKEFLRIFLLTFSAVTLIYLLAHFLGRLDEWIQFHASPHLILTLILLRIPRIFYEVLPIVILLTTLITCGLFARNNEIIAMRACGIGLRRVLIPIGTVSICLVCISLIDVNWMIPFTNRRISYLDDVALKKRPHLLALEKNRIWLRSGPNSFCNIQKVNPRHGVLYNVTLFAFNQQFELVKRIDAEQVKWNGETWMTKQGREWTFNHSGEIVKDRPFQGPFPLERPLDQILHVEKSSDEMGYQEIKDYIQIMKQNGFPTVGYEVDLAARSSYSTISLVMVLLGVPFALYTFRSGGVSIGIVWSLLIGFLYWLAFAIGISLGHAGILPPLWSAWIVNLLFGTVALLRLNRVRF